MLTNQWYLIIIIINEKNEWFVLSSRGHSYLPTDLVH